MTSGSLPAAEPEPQETASVGHTARLRGLALPFLCFLAAVLLLQWQGGAYDAEFVGHPDEAAHYVTGLMVRDYVAAGLPWPPTKFAEQYYLHYPKVALGHWPPLFYVVQSAWTLPLPATRASMLIFMAALTALLLTAVFAVARARLGAAAAWGAGLWMASLPITQEHSRMVMSDVLLTTLAFLAVVSFARYLETESLRWAAAFGVWASLAMLTKAHAAVLAPLPVLAVLLTRQFHLLRRFSFWLPALMVAASCGPWYLLAPGAQHESVVRFGGLDPDVLRMAHTPLRWASMLGLAPSLFAVVGLANRLRRGRERSVQRLWAVLGAVLISTLLAALLVGEFRVERVLLTSLVCCLLFACAGAKQVVQACPPRAWPLARKAWALAAILAVLAAWNVHAMPPKRGNGAAAVARDLLSRPEFARSVFLIASDSLGEGALISEIAMHEARPGHVVLRGSKVLVRTTWMASPYVLRYHTPAELMQYLDSIPVGVVVVDLRPRNRTPLKPLLLETFRAYPDHWQPLKSYSDGQPGGGPRFVAYQLAGHQQRPVGEIVIDLKPKLKRNIGN